MSHSFTSLRLANLNSVQNGLSRLFLFQVLCNFLGREIIILSLQFIAVSLTVPWDLTFNFFACWHVSMCCGWTCVRVSWTEEWFLIYIDSLNNIEPTDLCIAHAQCVEPVNELDIRCPLQLFYIFSACTWTGDMLTLVQTWRITWKSTSPKCAYSFACFQYVCVLPFEFS